jgi:hypothetical protein
MSGAPLFFWAAGFAIGMRNFPQQNQRFACDWWRSGGFVVRSRPSCLLVFSVPLRAEKSFICGP